MAGTKPNQFGPFELSENKARDNIFRWADEKKSTFFWKLDFIQVFSSYVVFDLHSAWIFMGKEVPLNSLLLAADASIDENLCKRLVILYLNNRKCQMRCAE